MGEIILKYKVINIKEITEEILEKMLEDAYNDGYRDGEKKTTSSYRNLQAQKDY